MEHEFSRTQLLLGKEAMGKLAASRVAVFGVGGVGGYVVEALVRSGIGALDLIDKDTVSLSNINRQIIATHSTIGRYKVDVAAERAADINPHCQVRTYRTFYLPETRDLFDFKAYDYVVDAIDTVTGKLALIMQAQEAGTPLISSMGAGNKLDPTAFEVADIYDTSVCPLAKVMRKECKKRGVRALKVVYSKEEPVRPVWEAEETNAPDKENLAPDSGTGTGTADSGSENKARKGRQKDVPGSAAFVPSAAGLIIAGEVVKDLTRLNG